jgi:hypothetical protein
MDDALHLGLLFAFPLWLDLEEGLEGLRHGKGPDGVDLEGVAQAEEGV